MTPGEEIPPLFRRILRAALPRDRREEILGDLRESHRARLERMDEDAARRLLRRELVGLIGWRMKESVPWTARGRGRRSIHDGDPLHGTRRTTMGRDFAQDLRFAVRTLVRRPGFSLTAVAVLALGIGAPTTVFSLVDAIFFRAPEHVAEPQRLVRIHRVTGPEQRPAFMGRPDYVHYRDGASTLAGLAAYSGPTPAAYARGDGAVGQLDLAFVSDEYFDVLGTSMVLGRDFRPEENREPGARPVIVLSHGFWSRELGADPGAVGRSIRVGETPFTVVGVAPEGFTGLSPVEPAPDAWTPVAMHGTVTGAGDAAWWERVPGREITWLQAVGRLADGVTVEAARAEMAALAGTVPREAGAGQEGVLVSRSVLYRPGEQATLSNLARILLGAVGIVLLIAVANVALLLLARTSARARELGIRTALGAGTGRVVRQLLAESLVLAAVGGALGVVLADRLSGLAGDLLPFPFLTSFRPGWPVLAAAVALTVVTALVAGLAPALRAARTDPARALKAGRSGPSGSRLRAGLVVAQVALSVTLMSGAFLFAGSFWTAHNQPLGFETENRLAVMVDLRSRGYGEDEGRAFVDRALERLRELPGVRAATTAFAIPFRGGWSTTLPVEPGGDPDGETFRLSLNMVSPDYFRVWGLPVIRGRAIGPEDVGGDALSVVVNETFAERYWPGQDPVGRTIDRGDRPMRVVGVARDATYRELDAEPAPGAYLSLDQRWMPGTHFVLHTNTDAAGMTPAVHAALRELDPGLTFPWTGTMESVLEEQTARYEVSAVLVGGFGVVALLLAAAGLYGVMSFLVARRTREIGIRMALGASTGNVTGRILGSGGRLVVVGIVLGLAGYLALRRFAEALVFGVSPADPLPPLLAALALLVVGALAAWGPARRAARVDPLEAMRTE